MGHHQMHQHLRRLVLVVAGPRSRAELEHVRHGVHVKHRPYHHTLKKRLTSVPNVSTVPW